MLAEEFFAPLHVPGDRSDCVHGAFALGDPQHERRSGDTALARTSPPFKLSSSCLMSRSSTASRSSSCGLSRVSNQCTGIRLKEEWVARREVAALAGLGIDQRRLKVRKLEAYLIRVLNPPLGVAKACDVHADEDEA